MIIQVIKIKLRNNFMIRKRDIVNVSRVKMPQSVQSHGSGATATPSKSITVLTNKAFFPPFMAAGAAAAAGAGSDGGAATAGAAAAGFLSSSVPNMAKAGGASSSCGLGLDIIMMAV
jgi:hypothetical protein